MDDKKLPESQAFRELFMAQWEGFEPSCRF